MNSPVTFQIQLEPDTELNEDNLKLMRSRMVDFVLSIDAWGFIRYEMYRNNEVWYEDKPMEGK